MIELPFSSLSFELTLREVKIYAVLLPPGQIPLSWLRQLALECLPELTTIPKSLEYLLDQLFRQRLLQAASGPVAHLDERGSRAFRDSLDEIEVREKREKLREFCTRRNLVNGLTGQGAVNRVLTGDPNLEVTAWTVPPLQEVLARALGDDRVEVIEHGDGTYSVHAKPLAPWEQESLTAFAVQEFTTDDLDAIEWALRTRLLSASLMRQSAGRVGELHLKEPANGHACLVSGLYWLTLAHKSYGEGGSCSASWHMAGNAVEILQAIQQHDESTSRLSELLEKAKKARWAYDD